MKIAGLKTFVVGNPPPAFGGRYFGFLKTSHAYSDSPFYSNPDAAAERSSSASHL
jgi:hypothetical protein